jgi:hypothetical protein
MHSGTPGRLGQNRTGNRLLRRQPHVLRAASRSRRRGSRGRSRARTDVHRFAGGSLATRACDLVMLADVVDVLVCHAKLACQCSPRLSSSQSAGNLHVPGASLRRHPATRLHRLPARPLPRRLVKPLVGPKRGLPTILQMLFARQSTSHWRGHMRLPAQSRTETTELRTPSGRFRCQGEIVTAATRGRCAVRSSR